MYLLLVSLTSAHAYEGRFLAQDDIILYGMQLTAAPAKQTVPKNIATIVSTYLQVPTMPAGQIPPLAPDATVRATLRGPGLETPLELAVPANSPFNIPPLTVPGSYSLDGIRLESGGQVLFYGTPESVKIEVIEKLLVTQVTARPLTAQEIRDKGIVFDKSNFQAYNFTAAFAIKPGQEINITMPVILPRLQTTQDVPVDGIRIPGIQGAQIQTLSTIIPDSLKLAQTSIPNLSVQSFTLKPDIPVGNNFFLPPIPGVVVIPGDIGFLNQYFSVMLMVGNVAPADSNLVVKDIKAEIILPPGRDEVVNTSDDPLRMAKTDRGESPRIQPVAKPGPDGKLGTGDDISELAPGETGNAEFLVEGRREGSHTVEMEITGTLYGLPIGPVPIRGRAMGTVLVRNPTFTMTFTHPDLVNAGERYNLDVTVTNTSDSPANFVSINLYPRYISGATLVGDPVRSIDSILPGDSATISYELISQVTGNVFAATLDSDEHIKGKFLLKTSVGELGIPLSPDSLVLPKEANSLPEELRKAALGMLGKAYATATAPAAALPKDVLRFGKKIVWDRGIETAEAGFRYALHEELPATASQLLMDFMGSNYSRIAELYPNQADRDAAVTDFTGFDDLRRRSVRGDTFAAAVANILKDEVAAKGALAFHRDLATRLAYRPGFVSLLATGDSGPLPVTISLVDGSGKRLGGVDAKGKVTKEIPFADYLLLNDTTGATTGQLAMMAVPGRGPLSLRIDPVSGVTAGSYTLSLIYPDATGALHQVSWSGLSGQQAPLFIPAAGDPVQLAVVAAGTGVPPAGSDLIPDLSPSIISVVQQPQADVHKCDAKDPGEPLGRVVAMLFSEEVTPESVQDKLPPELIANYSPEGNKVVGVSLQPGRRIAFVALRDPLGPFVPRTMTVANVVDRRGHAMAPQTVPMEATIEAFGGVVSGRILQADGSLVPGSEIRLVLQRMCDDEWVDVGIAAKLTDANAHYQWDYVRGGAFRVKEIAMDPDTNDVRRLQFSIARHGQRLNADIVFLGRGTVQGRVFGEDGVTPLKDVRIKVTNLVDQTEYGATTDANGRYVITRVPIGNSLVEAVHVETNSHAAQSTYIGTAGEVVELNLVLLTEQVKTITVKYGQVSGVVLRPDGATPVPGVPVIAFYQSGSQPGVTCPKPGECPVAMVTTDKNGAYLFPSIPAGSHRINSFDQAVYQEGNINLPLAADAKITGNILLNGGFGTVQGTVLDSEGRPVAGAQVGGGLVLATTDVNGAYELKDVPLGHAKIVAVSQALGASGSTEIDIIRNGELVNATIVLSAQGGVYGTVYLADGISPAGGIDVFALRQGDSGMQIAGTAVTNAQGQYQIKPLPVMTGAEYTISAFLPDLSDGNVTTTKVLFNGHQARANVTFKGKGRVEGVIYDDDGKTPLKARVSVSGLTVRSARGPGGKSVGLGFAHTPHIRIVDNDFSTGRFSFDNVFVGQFVITAGGAFSPDPITFSDAINQDGETRQVVLKLLPTSVITGRVYQPDGFTPVGEAVKVTFHSEETKKFCRETSIGEMICDTIPQGIQEENVYTLPDDGTSKVGGTFKVPIVNAGDFTLTAMDPVTGKSARVKGHVAAGQTADVKLRLIGKADVTVRVFGSDGVTPIIGARVDLERSEFPPIKKTGTAVDGTITFTGIDEGTFVVFAQDLSRGFSARKSGKVVKDGEKVTIDVYLYDATGVVYGTVYRPDGVTPVPNADVAIFNGQGPLAFNTTDSNGQYRQGTIPLGPVNVKVFEAATGRRGGGSGTVDLAGQQVPIMINEAAIGHVRGVAYDAVTMAPLRGWRVQLSISFPDGSALTLIGTTGPDGSYFFPGIPQGAFSVTVSRDGLGSASATGIITRENELIDLPLVVNLLKPALGSMDGMVFNTDGTPAKNYAICIDPSGEGCGVSLTAGEDGTFHAADLSLGRHTVVAKSQVTASSGSAMADLAFAGEAAVVKIVVDGLGSVSPVVVWQDNSPASGVQVVLEKAPNAGCGSSTCTRYGDSNGTATFTAVPPGNYTVWAHDPVRGLSGAASGVLHVGDNATPRLVLEVNGTVTGTAIYPDAVKRAGIIAALTGTTAAGAAAQHYTATDANGDFTLRGIKSGTYTLNLLDPLGSGMGRKYLVVNGLENVGTIILDDAPPSVRTISPVPGALKVALGQKVVITFSEPVQPGSVTAATVTVNDGSGTVAGTIAMGDGNTTVTFTPIAPLKEQTIYTVKVFGVTDNLDRPMARPFVASFTTEDRTPPAFQSVDPAAGTSGVPLESVIRIVYNEPIDPAAFSGPAITLSRGGAPVAGRVDAIFGNTGLVFTPTYPLVESGAYQVAVQPATDLSGNRQQSGLTYSFSALDRTPPVIAGLSPSNNGTVIEGSVASVSVNLGGASDVAFVDFMVNGTIVGTDRTIADGFKFNILSVPSLGKPGDTIRISAVATDTSGNRGTAVDTLFTITADTPPTVAISAPADGSAFKTGERVNVSVAANDDLGVSLVGYQAIGGQAPAAATTDVVPASTATTKNFAFYVPVDAIPGSTITVNATAIDTKGQTTKARPVNITVLDATPPQVGFTSPVTGAKVKPGQQVTAVVSAADLGGVASLEFRVSGGTVYSENRVIDPALNAVATTFTFTVSPAASPLETVNLDVTAVDKAGNRASAGQVKLAVADTHAPQVTLRTLTGSTEMVPGQPLTIVVDASDEVGVQRIDLTASGALTYANAKGISPPLGSAQAQFLITIPTTLADGATLNLQATAVDLSGNVSAPASLVLRGQSLPGVTLPASLVLNAGDQRQIDLLLSAPAPANGAIVSITSANAGIAVATPTLIFAPGEQSKPITISAVSGGTVQLRAFIGSVERTAMTVTVGGGIVTGTVYNPYPNPVAGAEVMINGYSVTTDATGRFSISGIAGPGVTFRANDPQTKLKGYLAASMNAANGYLKDVQIQLIPAASLAGTVRKADGVTSAGAGVQVDVFRSGDLSTPLDTVFTDAAGHFEFPLLQVGTYVINAATGQGEKGRANAAILQSGLDVNVVVVFLGKGNITGLVVDGAGTPVANPELRLGSYSLFGAEQRLANGPGSGTFSFSDIFVGDFSLSARDPVTRMSAGASGKIATNGETVQLTLRLASVGSITGTVYRYDGVTPVSGATVSAGSASTTTDTSGGYLLETVPLGVYTVTADDKSARSRSSAPVSLQTHGATVTRNLTMPGQGNVVVTVTNASGPVGNADVTLHDGYGTVTQKTAADGVTIFNQVQAGNVSLYAYSGNASATGSASVAVGGSPAVALALPTIQVPVASITGIVYAPDGKTPLAGITVGGGQWSVATGADGTYRLDNHRLATYQLYFVDSTGMVRAKAANVVLNQDGQTVVRDVTLVGLGSVSGRVLMPDASSASSIRVNVRSMNADFGRTATAITDAAGYYLVERLPVGQFTVSAGDAARQLLGETAGLINADGDTASGDIVLQNNAFTPPRTLQDGNLYSYDIQQDGTLANGQNGAFTQNGRKGAVALELIAGSIVMPFAGDPIATQEDQSRELALRQQNLAGLNVTRKVFVPRDGYFARYLEIVSNPTLAPVTVDLRLRTNFSAGSAGVIATSSGDSDLQVIDPATRDYWAVIDDGNATQPPAVALVWGGTGAVPPSSAAFAAASGGSPANLQATWQSVTVQPGQTMALLHFVVQGISRDGAKSAAERLVQMPPETLSGLSGDELAAIANFVVPADGSSPLASLPPLTGEITGQVLASDGLTPAPAGTPVTIVSDQPIFAKSFQTTTDGSGIFRFSSNLFSASPSIGIPLTGFTLTARVARGAAFDSPPVAGSFGAGTSSTTKNVAFSNSGILAGTVQSGSGLPLAGVSVRIANGAYNASATTPQDGSYRFAFLPPGSYSITVEKVSSQGGSAVIGYAVVVTAGSETRNDLIFPALATVTGSVKSASGTAVGGATVRLAAAGFQRTAGSDSSGSVTFFEVPAGSYSVTATDPGSGLTATAPVTVIGSGTTPFTLAFPSSGRISGSVLFADNVTPASGVLVEIFDAVTGALLKSVTSGSSFETGILVSNAASFRVRGTFTYATAGGNRSVGAELIVPGFGGSNVTVPAKLTLPVNRTTLLTRLFLADSSRYLGDSLTIEARSRGDGTLLTTCSSGTISGECSMTNLVAGSDGITVRAVGSGGTVAEKSATVTASSGTTTVDLTVPVTGATMPVTFYDGNGAPYRIEADGRLSSGLNTLFETGSASTGGAVLELVAGGITQRFTGGSAAVIPSGSGRELALRQDNLAGLTVIRRIAVPADGYFVRYLDTLINTGSAPVTVDLNLRSQLAATGSAPQLVTTSNGDANLLPSLDRWAMFDDGVQDDPFLVPTANLPPMAAVWQGSGATLTPAGLSYGAGGELLTSWGSVTVPAGGSVELLHFVTQQASRSGAQASAGRLALLPPEVLAGLSSSDRAAIRNFAVPASGQGVLQPLPPLDGTVSGKVIANDGVTLAPAGSPVSFTSSNAYYGRTYRTVTDAAGIFSFSTALDKGPATVGIVRDVFDLNAMVTFGGVTVPATASGDFNQGGAASAKDVYFTIMPRITTVVPSQLFANQSPVTVQLNGNNFTASSEVLLEGVPLTTEFVPPTALRATVPMQLVAGAKALTVRNPDPIHPGSYVTSAAATLTVVLPQFSLTPNPLTVRQKESGTLTIAIPFTAPAGGITANLTSTDPATATVPATVTIPAGASSATFAVTAPDTTQNRDATVAVHANLNNWLGSSTQVTVRPEPTVNLTPTALLTGQGFSFFLTISLTDPAPVGGLVVALAASTANVVSFPASVTITAGATQAQVTVINSGTGNTAISATPAAGKGFSSGDSCTVTVKPVQTYNIGPTVSSPVGIMVGTTSTPAAPPTPVTPFLSTPVGVAVGAVVKGLSPNSAPIDTQNQVVRVYGSGLGEVTDISFSPSTGITVHAGSLNKAADGSYAEVTVNIAADAPIAPRVTVVKTGMTTATPASPGATQFTVTYPPPVIWSLIPNSSLPGTMTLQVNGRNLYSTSVVTFEPADGIYVSSSISVSSDGTLVSVPITIDPTAAVGRRVVRITAPGGTTSVVMSPANTFGILSVAGDLYTSIVAPQVGVLVPTTPATEASRTYTPFVSLPVGIAVGPIMNGVAPASGAIGTNDLKLRITGSSLDKVNSITFNPSTGITVAPGSLTAAADGTYVEALISIAADAPLTARSVILMAGSYSVPPAAPGANIFRVTLPQPMLYGISPIRNVVGSSFTMTLNGTLLAGATSVSFIPPDGITVANPPTVSSDGIVATVAVTLAANAPTTARAVTITTPGGTTTDIPSTANSFTVTSVPGTTYTPIVSSQVGVMVATAPAPTSAPATYTPIISAQVGVNVPFVPPRPNSDLVGYWKMNGDWTDSSGNGLNGTPVNSPSFSTDKILGSNSGSFGGASDYVAIGNLYGRFPNNAFTVEGWVKASGTGAGGINIIAGGAGAWADYGIGLINDQLMATTVNKNTQVGYYAKSGSTVQTGTWYHVAGTYDGNWLKLYVNGELKNTVYAEWVQNNGSVDFWLGGGQCCSNYNYNGLLDDIALYNRALSASEVTSRYNAGLSGDSSIPASSVSTFGPITSQSVGVIVGYSLSDIDIKHMEPGTTTVVVISGVGLDKVTGVKVAPATGVTVGTITPSPDGSTLSVQLTADTTAPRAVRALVPMIGTTPVSAPVPGSNLLYVGLRPSLVSISPILQTVGNTFTLTINGTSLDSATMVRFEPSDGVTVMNPPVINATGTQATVTVIIDGMAKGGQRVVVVDGPFGPSDNTPGANNTFNVSRPVVQSPAGEMMMAGRSTPAPSAQAGVGWPVHSDLLVLAGQAMPAIPVWRQQTVPVYLASPALDGDTQNPERKKVPHQAEEQFPLLMLAMASRGYRGPPDELAV
ncbi:carboxypeptidase regulatory-like domain-containing protein [Geobacter argillaceus]|uniref:carboxypeptidase regulatory-like domain-containing protein n=1 Tax=Geobacter argillaceus TaxID=345631 RepID=UPI001B873158|nr:carboxypeptidase regulatory-like domain-containing protein [Geobacter argillaceus]